MRLAALLLCLVLYGCANPASAQIDPPPDPPNPGNYDYCEGGHAGEILALFSNGKVQVTLNFIGGLPYYNGPCGLHDNEVFQYIAVMEGTLSGGYQITNGKLKSVFTNDGTGSFTVYWPAVNGVAGNVVGRFNITNPMTAQWNGENWSVNVTGGFTETVCPTRTGVTGGTFCFSN